MSSTLTVFLYSAVAAASAALGVLPLVGRERVPRAWIGWANALAGGMMLGAAYLLTVAQTARPAVVGAAGAVLGIAFVYATHAASGTGDLDLDRPGGADPDYGSKVLLVGALHSAAEGVAIGAAMAVSSAFGIFMALSIAAHNVPEATILCALLRRRGARLSAGAALAVAANASQVLLAVVTFSLIAVAPGVLPWALGFAMGGLVYLVLVDLLPESYRQAGHTSIALVTSVAMAIVVLLRGYS